MQQLITWTAHYADGTTLPQHEGDKENRYLDIDRSRLVAFSLRKDGQDVLTVHLDPGMRLIYRRRVFLRLGADAPTVFYLVGWQKTVGGENVQAISVIAEDSGKVHVIGRWRDDHPVFSGVELIDGEDVACAS